MKRALFAAFVLAEIWAIACLTVALGDEAPEPTYNPFPPTTGTHHVLILDVYDGDTVTAAFLVPVRFRLSGIDAPEVRGKEKELGRWSRNKLRGVLTKHRVVKVELDGTDKYGRTLAELWVEDTEPLSVNEWMLGAGHARPYPAPR